MMDSKASFTYTQPKRLMATQRAAISLFGCVGQGS